MKILFINQFYWPDLAATAQRLTDLAEHLAAEGHEVHVLCSRGEYDRGTGAARPRRERRNAVHIHRVTGLAAGKRGGLRRVLDYAWFHFCCAVHVLLGGWRYGLIVSLTTPPLIGLCGAILRKVSFGRVRYVYWAMDLHPDIEFELGMWSRKNPLWRFLDSLNGFQLRAADAVVALGEKMKERLAQKGVAAERIHVIPMWADRREVRPKDVSASSIRRQQGWDGRFVVMYAGNAGVIHDFEAVTRAMLELRADRRILFAFIGGGHGLARIEAFARSHRLENFAHIPYVPQEQLSDLLAAAEVHLVTLRQGMQGLAVPCKLYGILAAGRPVIYIGPAESDTAAHVREAQAGRVLACDDAQGLVAALDELAGDPNQRQRSGEKAERAFLARYERLVGCGLWSRLVENLTGVYGVMDLCEPRKP